MRIEDWKERQLSESLQESLFRVNPRFPRHTNQRIPAWNRNCQRCVPAYEMRRRGYEVSALPRNFTNDYLPEHPFDVWKDPIIHKDIPGTGRESIERAMASYGDGARAEIGVIWDTPGNRNKRKGRSGHVFVAEQRDGKTHFIDPQNGNADVSWYFDRAMPGKTEFARIDNLTPSDRIFECCANSQANAINFDTNGNRTGNCDATIPAQDIDMSTARGLPSAHFWNRRASERQFWENHGENKDFYLKQAEGLPEVQSMLSDGKSLDQIRAERPSLSNTLDAYYEPGNMIKVNRDENGNVSFLDDGKHRILAARELGYDMPVHIENDQMESNAQVARPEKLPNVIEAERKMDRLLAFPSSPSKAISNNANPDGKPAHLQKERDLPAERQAEAHEYGAGVSGAEKIRNNTPASKSGMNEAMNGTSSGTTFSIDSNGSITVRSNLKLQKSDHSHMPPRTEAYRPGVGDSYKEKLHSMDERGHIQASSFGVGNEKWNVVAQNYDVNHYGYREIERGETDALKAGASIDSTKIAYVGSKPGDRPTAFMINDTVTYPDGHVEHIYNSMSNESYAEQDEDERILNSIPWDDDTPNPDAARESMSPEEYEELAAEADEVVESFDIRDEYAPANYSESSPRYESKGDAESAQNVKNLEMDDEEKGEPSQGNQSEEEAGKQKETSALNNEDAVEDTHSVENSEKKQTLPEKDENFEKDQDTEENKNSKDMDVPKENASREEVEKERENSEDNGNKENQQNADAKGLIDQQKASASENKASGLKSDPEQKSTKENVSKEKDAASEDKNSQNKGGDGNGSEDKDKNRQNADANGIKEPTLSRGNAGDADNGICDESANERKNDPVANREKNGITDPKKANQNENGITNPQNQKGTTNQNDPSNTTVPGVAKDQESGGDGNGISGSDPGSSKGAGQSNGIGK